MIHQLTNCNGNINTRPPLDRRCPWRDLKRCLRGCTGPEWSPTTRCSRSFTQSLTFPRWGWLLRHIWRWWWYILSWWSTIRSGKVTRQLASIIQVFKNVLSILISDGTCDEVIPKGQETTKTKVCCLSRGHFSSPLANSQIMTWHTPLWNPVGLALKQMVLYVHCILYITYLIIGFKQTYKLIWSGVWGVRGPMKSIMCKGFRIW